eukprot:287688_1
MDCMTEDPIPFPPDGVNDDAIINAKESEAPNEEEEEEEEEGLSQQKSLNTISIHCKTQDDDDDDDDLIDDEGGAYRVKLYELSDDGNWKDEGTGTIEFALCRDDRMMKSIEIRIVSEDETQQILLEHTAFGHILYDKQGDSIIQWLDGRQIERAISFEHRERCQELWHLIGLMKGEDEFEGEGELLHSFLSMPSPNANNLCEVYGKVKHAVEDKDASALNEMARREWREALYCVFESMEERNDGGGLEYIFLIVLECCRECEQIKLLSSEEKEATKTPFATKIEHSLFCNTLMMVFLGKEFISKSIAMLEYDPIRIKQQNENRVSKQCKHRSFLALATRKSCCNSMEKLSGEIEYVYKLNYVRDCVLLGKLDVEQQAFHILNHHIARYNAVICETIAQERMTQTSAAFVSELLCRIKSINDTQTRGAIFIQLIRHGLLDTAEIEVLVECVHHMISCNAAPQIRAFIVQQMEDKRQTLLHRLCGCFAIDYEGDIHLDQIYYVVCALLALDDWIGLPDRDILSLSYDVQRGKHLHMISCHFFDDCVSLFVDNMTQHVINLFSACGQQDEFIPKLKQLEQKHNLMSSIHSAILTPNKHLSMSCIRFLRQCLHLAQHDPFWSTRIQKHALFTNVMQIFESNGLDTYNMMNSTILSLFATIEDKKIEELIVYLGDQNILQKYNKLIHYTTAFADLTDLYEKAKHGLPIQSQIDSSLSNCSSLSPRISPQQMHYQDSPRPDLKLPSRAKQQSFDLLANANAIRHKHGQRKKLNLSITTNGKHKDTDEDKEDTDKESSPFLVCLAKAMKNTTNGGIKRKYCDISVQHIADHDPAAEQPTKKIKLMNTDDSNGYHVNDSPDTFDMDIIHSTQSILLNSKTHNKHNKHVHFETDDGSSNHDSNTHPIDDECMLHADRTTADRTTPNGHAVCPTAAT